MYPKNLCIKDDFVTIKNGGNYNDREMESFLKWYHSENIKVRGNRLIVNGEYLYEYSTK